MSAIPEDQLVRAAPEDPQPGQRFEHVRSGGLYEVVGVGLEAQDASKRVVVYRNVAQPAAWLWVRSLSEFTDGRFRLVQTNAKPT